jgi:WD40 repeat protein
MSEGAQPIISFTVPNRSFESHKNTIIAVAVFPDGRRMVTSADGQTLRLWDLRSGVVLKEMEGHSSNVQAVAVSGDGKLIASGDNDGKLIAWHGGTCKSLHVTNAHRSNRVSSLDFSPDGAVLATGSSDTTTKLWSTEFWEQDGGPIRCGDAVTCVRYSPSGELAIAAFNHIKIWNPRTKDCIAKLEATYNFSLAWTPDGTRLLSAGYTDGPTIREWDTSTWHQVGDPWSGHTWSINALAVNSAGTLVASASYDKHVRLWRRSNRRTIAIFIHSERVYFVAFSMDGKRIFSGGSDYKISEWAIPEDALRAPEVSLFPFIPALSLSHLAQPRGSAVLSSKNYGRNVTSSYPAAVDLDSASEITCASRCIAKLRNMRWKDALLDAQKVRYLYCSSFISQLNGSN